jgi:hypothetical protein
MVRPFDQLSYGLFLLLRHWFFSLAWAGVGLPAILL